jgi:hypothetical protein
MGIRFLNDKKLLEYKYFKSLFFFLILVTNFDLAAQVKDSLKSAPRHPKVDGSMVFLIPLEPNTLRIEFHPPKQDTIFDRSYNDSNCSFTINNFNLSHLSSSLNIQYLNDSIWFIYGTRTEYAYYPFIYRTTNTGLSWQSISEAWPGKDNRPMDREMFHMFNLKKGIWLIGLQNNKMEYRITNDGGYTWIRKKFKVKNRAAINKEHPALHVKYLESNVTQISINYHVLKEGKWSISEVNPIYQSPNQGRKFKKVN